MFDQGSVAFMPLNFAQYRTHTSYPYYVTQNSNFAIKTLKMPGKSLLQFQLPVLQSQVKVEKLELHGSSLN